MMLTLPIGLAAVILLTGAGLWALRRHRSPRAAETAAPTVSSAGRHDQTKVASIGIGHLIIPDPSFGWWPISGDYLLNVPPDANAST